MISSHHPYLFLGRTTLSPTAMLTMLMPLSPGRCFLPPASSHLNTAPELSTAAVMEADIPTATISDLGSRAAIVAGAEEEAVSHL